MCSGLSVVHPSFMELLLVLVFISQFPQPKQMKERRNIYQYLIGDSRFLTSQLMKEGT